MLSRGRYFRVAEKCTVHGPYEVTVITRLKKCENISSALLFVETYFFMLLNYLITVCVFQEYLLTKGRKKMYYNFRVTSRNVKDGR